MLTAISHKEPDRVPTGEWQFGPEIITPLFDREPLFFNGIKTIQGYWEGKRDEIIDDWKKGLVELVLRLEWDAVLVHNVIGKGTPIEVPEQIEEGKWRYKNGDVLSYSRETDRLMFTERGKKDSAPVSSQNTDISTMEPTDSELEVVRYVVNELGRTHFVFSASLFGHPQLNFSDASVSEVETWVKLYEDPEKYRDESLKYVNSPAAKRGIEIAKQEGIDGIACGCDYGYNTGPFMSPEMFRKAILPGLSAHVSLVHSFDMLMLLHSCGNNQVLMDMVVEAGVDVYQSIQPEMDIVKMKKRYGKNITLWGGVPAGDLVCSTPEKIKETARYFIDSCKEGGGYIFGTSHSVMPGALYENYMAMLEVCRTYGMYQ